MSKKVFEALQTKNIEQLKQIIDDDYDINQPNEDGDSLLHEATKSNCISAIKLLLSLPDVEINIRNCKNLLTPLCYAKTEYIAKLLIHNGAEANLVGMDSSVLHLACNMGNEEMVRYLMDKVTDINLTTTRTRVTPLHEACRRDNVEIVRLLLENRADVQKLDNRQNTALTLAKNIDIIKMLRDYGANVNSIGLSTGPLHFACKNGRLQVAELLLTFENVDVNSQTKATKRTPLHEACEAGHKEIIMLLLKKNADMFKVDNVNKSPYDIANENIKEVLNLFRYGNSESLAHLNKEKLSSKNETSKANLSPSIKIRNMKSKPMKNSEETAQLISKKNVFTCLQQTVKNLENDNEKLRIEVEKQVIQLLENIPKNTSRQISSNFSAIINNIQQDAQQAEADMKQLSSNVVGIQNESKRLEMMCNQNRESIVQSMEIDDDKIKEIGEVISELKNSVSSNTAILSKVDEINKIWNEETTKHKSDFEQLSSKIQSSEAASSERAQQVERLQERVKNLEYVSNKLNEIEQETNRLAETSLHQTLLDKLQMTSGAIDNLTQNAQIAENQIKLLDANLNAIQRESKRFEETYNENTQLMLQNLKEVDYKMKNFDEAVNTLRANGCLTVDMDAQIANIKHLLNEQVSQAKDNIANCDKQILQTIEEQKQQVATQVNNNTCFSEQLSELHKKVDDLTEKCATLRKELDVFKMKKTRKKRPTWLCSCTRPRRRDCSDPDNQPY